MGQELADAVNDLLIRGHEDDIQAAEVASVVMRVCRAATQDEVRERSLELIREVVRQGLMEIGEITGTGFHPTRRYASGTFHRWALSFEEGASGEPWEETRALERSAG